eukprot:5118341-Pyramimonas_sp.AAC.1
MEIDDEETSSEKVRRARGRGRGTGKRRRLHRRDMLTFLASLTGLQHEGIFLGKGGSRGRSSGP